MMVVVMMMMMMMVTMTMTIMMTMTMTMMGITTVRSYANGKKMPQDYPVVLN